MKSFVDNMTFLDAVLIYPTIGTAAIYVVFYTYIAISAAIKTLRDER